MKDYEDYFLDCGLTCTDDLFTTTLVNKDETIPFRKDQYFFLVLADTSACILLYSQQHIKDIFYIFNMIYLHLIYNVKIMKCYFTF